MYNPSSNPIYDDYSAKGGRPPAPVYGVPMRPQNSGNSQFVPYPEHEEPWTTGLYDCNEDLPNCFLTFWCPCVTFGRVTEIVDRGSTSCGASAFFYSLIVCITGCGCCIYSCFYRTKMRKQLMLGEKPCNDFVVHCCCEYCALCQEFRELENRGFDLTIGWHGNIERQQQQMQRGQMAPPMEHGMKR